MSKKHLNCIYCFKWNDLIIPQRHTINQQHIQTDYHIYLNNNQSIHWIVINQSNPTISKKKRSFLLASKWKSNNRFEEGHYDYFLYDYCREKKVAPMIDSLNWCAIEFLRPGPCALCSWGPSMSFVGTSTTLQFSPRSALTRAVDVLKPWKKKTLKNYQEKNQILWSQFQHVDR